MPTQTSIRTVLDQILTILQVNDANQRERMVDEVEQVVQTKAILLSLAALPEDARKNLPKLPEGQVMDLLRQHIGEETITRTLEQATESIIPEYITELAKTATSDQKKAIAALVDPLAKA